MKTTGLLLGLCLLLGLALILPVHAQYGSGTGAYGSVGQGGSGGATNGIQQSSGNGTNTSLYAVNLVSGNANGVSNYNSFTNSMYVSELYGNDATAVFGDPHRPSQNYTNAMSMLQAAFPGGSFVILSGSEIYTNFPFNAGNGTTYVISNNMEVLGNGAQIWGYSNSRPFNVAPVVGGTIVFNDVIFSTTNNAKNASNKQGACLTLTVNTNASMIFNRCSFEGTIDTIFTAGTITNSTCHIEFNNCEHWLGGWDLWVEGGTVQNATNVVVDFNHCHLKTDPNLLNVWGVNRSTTVNPSSISRCFQVGQYTYNFNDCVLESLNNTGLGASTITGSANSGAVLNLRNTTLLCDSSSAGQMANISAGSTFVVNLYGCVFTNLASIQTNGGTVNIPFDITGNNGNLADLYFFGLSASPPPTPGAGINLWVSNSTALYALWTNGLNYQVISLPTVAIPFLPIETNFISGWGYSNTLYSAPIIVTATVTNQTTAAALMELRITGGSPAGGAYTNMVTFTSGMTNTTMFGIVPSGANYTFTNTMGTAGVRFGQLQPE